MSLPVGPKDLQQLKMFLDFVNLNPTVLNDPKLHFMKEFIDKFGGKVPRGEYKIPTGGSCPFAAGANADIRVESDNSDASVSSEPEEVEMESEPESDIELDMDGVVEDDTIPDQQMGDCSKLPTEEEIEKSSDFRSQAAVSYSEQKYEECIDLYTKAIELNPGNALFYAKRGQAFLKLKKPKSCIRDCDMALQLNCDSAAAYKFRGRAHGLLGNWELSAKDLRQACKLDFDEEANEWLREVTPNAKKIEQHRIKQERKATEKDLKQKEERYRRVQEANKRAQDMNKRSQEKQQEQKEREKKQWEQKRQERKPQDEKPEEEKPQEEKPQEEKSQEEKQPKEKQQAGKKPIKNFRDLCDLFEEPELACLFQDILDDRDNIEKYKSNPNFAKLMSYLDDGSMINFLHNEKSAKAKAPDSSETTTSNSKAQFKKPDFSDDGLD